MLEISYTVWPLRVEKSHVHFMQSMVMFLPLPAGVHQTEEAAIDHSAHLADKLRDGYFRLRLRKVRAPSSR